MSDITELKEIVSAEVYSSSIVSGEIVDQLTITEKELRIYTTKNGSPWQQKDIKFLEDCILYESIDDVVKYAKSKLCTIICLKGETVIWSGGPVKASEFFSE